VQESAVIHPACDSYVPGSLLFNASILGFAIDVTAGLIGGN
jgi:hypothetical protein